MLTLGIRPEDLAVGDGEVRIPFAMDIHERLGPTSYLHGRSGSDKIIAEHRQRGRVAPEAVGHLAVRPGSIHLFGPDGKSLRQPAEGSGPARDPVPASAVAS